MEVSALKQTTLPALRGPSALLRLQSDERLIAMIRRGQHAAFETLFARYHARLLAFCRHMLGSKEDAEDVLQEVFAAAFNAILADQREINVRPWLYRIARNRSLNHLRKASAIGVDSMDVHFAEGGISTGEKVMRRESFRQLIEDVQELPETQRTALLLREIDALSYDQIAEAMETTIPSVKSLLVRARISLAEAAEARQLTCEQVRQELGEAAEGLIKTSAPARRHVRSCERCRSFRKQLKSNNTALAAVMPVGAALVIRKLIASKIGAGASHVAGGAGAGASAAAVGGGSAAGGLATAGVGTIATKAVAGLAAAALVTAGAVEAGHTGPPRHHRHQPTGSSVLAATAPAAAPSSAPVVVRALPQPASAGRATTLAARAAKSHGKDPRHPGKAAVAQTTTTTSTSETLTTSSLSSSSSETESSATAHAETGEPPATEVVTETTTLPSSTQTTTTSTDTSTSANTSASSTTTSSSTATSTPSTAPAPVVAPQQAGGTPAPEEGAPAPLSPAR
jgi:RNA polymerase sigma factor (sigma-70 family)